MAIYHIVLIKFTAQATLAQKQAWYEGITALSSSIPEIKEILSGKKLPHVKDGGWDNVELYEGVIMKFDNENDLRTYSAAKPHTDYQQATAEQTADKLIFDIQT